MARIFSCNDLSPVEHDGLQELTRRRNRRTGSVVVNGTSLSVLDALVEMGFLRREEGRVLVLQPCCGHPRSPGDLRAPHASKYTGGAGYEINPRSLTGQRPSTRGSISSIRAIIDSFAAQCRVHHWSSGITSQGRAALGASFKRWIEDGATLEEIEWIVDQFFTDLRVAPQQHGHLWKMFIARKTSLFMAYERQHTYDKVEAHRHDAEFWVR